MIDSLDLAFKTLLQNCSYCHQISPLTVFLIALFVGFLGQFIIKRVIIRYLSYVSLKTKTSLDNHLLDLHVLDRLSNLFPAIILYLSCPLFLSGNTPLIELARRLIFIYFIYLGTRCLTLFLSALERTYKELPTSRNRPIKSYVQMGKLVLILASLIVIISIIINKSPVVLLSGLGALTAILILVFKDAILGLVASIQLAANDMVRIGDWIELPKHNTDGDVVDINLTTIKIKNWDNTLSMLPAHVFITDAFKNWRNMSESGARRIKRSLVIDMGSVRFCTQDMLERFKKMMILIPYLDQKISEIESYNKEHQFDLNEVVNGRRLTNLGTFRAYIVAYLKRHPQIRQDMTLLVRQLQSGPEGVVLEIYVFSKETAWAAYENIQADIFDHLYAVAPEFGLRLAQKPVSADFQNLKLDK